MPLRALGNIGPLQPVSSESTASADQQPSTFRTPARPIIPNMTPSPLSGSESLQPVPLSSFSSSNHQSSSLAFGDFQRARHSETGTIELLRGQIDDLKRRFDSHVDGMLQRMDQMNTTNRALSERIDVLEEAQRRHRSGIIAPEDRQDRASVHVVVKSALDVLYGEPAPIPFPWFQPDLFNEVRERQWPRHQTQDGSQGDRKLRFDWSKKMTDEPNTTQVGWLRTYLLDHPDTSIKHGRPVPTFPSHAQLYNQVIQGVYNEYAKKMLLVVARRKESNGELEDLRLGILAEEGKPEQNRDPALEGWCLEYRQYIQVLQKGMQQDKLIVRARLQRTMEAMQARRAEMPEYTDSKYNWLGSIYCHIPAIISRDLDDNIRWMDYDREATYSRQYLAIIKAVANHQVVGKVPGLPSLHRPDANYVAPPVEPYIAKDFAYLHECPQRWMFSPTWWSANQDNLIIEYIVPVTVPTDPAEVKTMDWYKFHGSGLTKGGMARTGVKRKRSTREVV